MEMEKWDVCQPLLRFVTLNYVLFGLNYFSVLQSIPLSFLRICLDGSRFWIVFSTAVGSEIIEIRFHKYNR